MAKLKRIPGFINYRISPLGKVYKKLPNGLLKLQRTWIRPLNGYVYVQLKKEQGVLYRRTVHSLVAKAFIDNPQNKKEVNHKDGNKENNRRSNLEWATHSENMKHAHLTGLINNRKLGNDSEYILVEYSKGRSLRNLASEFKVSKGVIRGILQRNGVSIKALDKGEAHPQARLTNEEVLEIYKLAHSGKYTQKELGILYNVNSPTIGKIKRGLRWAHLTQHKTQ